MALTPDKKSGQVVFKFGAGLNSQSAPDDVDLHECVSGKNFDLPADSRIFKARKPIALVTTATNGAEIRGLIQLVKADLTRSFLIQAGGIVYQWDGTVGSGLTAVGTCSAAAKLRGPLEANSIKDNKVFISDLNQSEVVLTWDGTTFQPLVTNLSTPFYAKYITVDHERVWYGNVYAGSSLPHVVVASKQDTPGTISTSQKPASSLTASDQFYLPTPNLSPIRGLVPAFGKLAIATKSASWFTLSGSNATDHALEALYAGEGGNGDEEVVFVGNDVVFGKQGAIDTLSATQRYGDVKSDDLTRWIHQEVVQIPGWTMAYSKRNDRVYCVPTGGGSVYVLHKALLDDRTRADLFGGEVKDISPWSKWQTDHAFNFVPTAMMRMLDPVSGLEYVYMGDSAGRLWQMDSDSVSTDGGTSFTVERVTAPVSVEPSQFSKISGWVKSQKKFSGSFTITALWSGDKVYDTPAQTVTLSAATNAPVWGGGSYWGGGAYWGLSASGRIARSKFTLPGGSDELQLKLSIPTSSLADFGIEEIGIQVAPERP